MNTNNLLPQYLYHYTSVDTLELILSNRTFRFNPLTVMDDRQEQWNAHGTAHGHFWFISSWTEAEDEIKEMWTQYCKPDATRGVRIKLPINPFSETENKLGTSYKESLAALFNIWNKYFWKYYRKIPKDYDENQILSQKLINEYPEVKSAIAKEMDELMHTTVMCYPDNVNKLLRKVEYTDEKSKLMPVTVSNYKGMFFEDDSDYCRYKNTSWAWQREWRYAVHFQMQTPGKIKSGGKIELYKLPFDYYDMKLDSEKLKRLEIVTSPVISEEALKKLNAVLKKYCPTAKVEPSKLESLG